MKKQNLPDYQKTAPALSRTKAEGRTCRLRQQALEAGMIFDAIDFYQKANHAAGLEEIKKTAEAAGDLMAFMR